jgi:dephospho-CoA kinase
MIEKIKVGITGGIGSGKSLVCQILENMGYEVFYSDKVAKELVRNSLEIRTEIISILGENAYDLKGQYNSKYISEIVFKAPKKLIQLNQIIHPKVRKEFEYFVSRSNSKIIFNEAAILYETGGNENFDKIILITAPLETRIKRCMTRDKSTKEQVFSKINQQWSDEKKRSFNPIEVINDEKTPLLTQIEGAIEIISKRTRKLEKRDDIEFLVNSFYGKVLKNESLSPFFKHLDFEKHLPKMIDFWCFVLIGTTGYTTNVIEKHVHMPLKSEHFELWLRLFHETLDELFEGENVAVAKQRAFTIAWTTKSKMNLI